MGFVLNFLLEIFFFFLFVDWTRVVWATRVSGQWYRSMIVMVFLVPERRSRSPMLYLKLNVLSCLGCFLSVLVLRERNWYYHDPARENHGHHLCSENGQSLSHGAPVQLLSLILGLSSAWWRIGSRSLGTSGFVVSPWNLQVFRQHSTLYLCTSGVPTTRRQYGAELFTLGALFLAHMAMAGSASLNVEMILRVIPPLKWHGWLDRNGR